MPDPTVKFVCEFFFANFWHWLALLVIVVAISTWREAKNG